MRREVIEETITQLLVDHLGVSREDVKPDALLVPEHDLRSRIVGTKPHLGADSLDIVELVMAVEEEFSIEIPDDEAEPLNEATVDGFVDFIAGKVLAKAA